ncbi:MAG TPA: FUSC family protein [Nocardioides sp.]|nr:FUSC family protein [Nocardioides sp.]
MLDVRLRLARVVARVRAGWRASLLWSGRITIAATLSYVVAMLMFPGTLPLLAPLTAMLVVQVTPVSLLASGLDRVLAVVAGVSLAVLFASFVPLEWWSLGLLIFAAITVGQALRLRSNLIEVAISGMLVLGVGSFAAELAAWQRITETLVGAAVGILSTLVFPPKAATADAGAAIDGLADRVSDLLVRAADEMDRVQREDGDLAAAARAWLGEARAITHDVPRIGAALLQAEQGRRLNVRSVGTSDVGPGLRQGLEALEHASITVRGTFRAVLDATADDAWPGGQEAATVLARLSGTFRAMAAGVDAFGQLVKEEADPDVRLSSADVEGVRRSLDALHRARTRIETELRTGAGGVLLELDVAVLSAVKRLLQELDLDARVRRQVRLVRPRRTGRAPGPAREGRAEVTPEPSSEDETQVLPVQPQERRRHRR